MDEQNNCCQHGNIWLIKSGLKIAIMVLVIIAGILLIRNWAKSYNYIGSPAVRDTITIEGIGRVNAIPDIATFTVGVQTEKATVAEAQKETNDKMNNIIKKLKETGIKETDIKTTDYSIYPQYNWDNSRQTLRGYQVNQSVAVKIRDLLKVSDTLAMAGSLGANNIGGISFIIDEPETYKQEAREKALKQAKDKAEALSKTMGVKIRKIVGFTESSADQTPMYLDSYKSMGMAEGGGGVSNPTVPAGSNEVVVYASVTYQIE